MNYQCLIKYPKVVAKQALIVFHLLFAIDGVAYASDFQFWQSASLRVLETDYVNFYTSGHFRFTDDISDFSLFRLGQQAIAKPLPWLDVALAYRYAEVKDDNGTWLNQHRVEFQLNPHTKLGERYTLSLRNRLELRWHENSANREERTRQRLRLHVLTPELGLLRAMYFSNELFYDFDRGIVSENRLVPFGLNFRPTKQIGLRAFFMLRSIHEAGDWTHIPIIGTGLSFAL